MSRYINTTFSSSRVVLDGNEFVGCIFDKAELVYSGGKPPRISGCQFNEFKMAFDGPAANTVQFMKAMGAPVSGMRKVVADTFPEVFHTH